MTVYRTMTELRLRKGIKQWENILEQMASAVRQM